MFWRIVVSLALGSSRLLGLTLCRILQDSEYKAGHFHFKNLRCCILLSLQWRWQQAAAKHWQLPVMSQKTACPLHCHGFGNRQCQNTRHFLFIAIAVKVSVGLGKQMPIDHHAGDLHLFWSRLILWLAYVSTINPTWIGLGSNLACRGERLATPEHATSQGWCDWATCKWDVHSAVLLDYCVIASALVLLC